MASTGSTRSVTLVVQEAFSARCTSMIRSVAWPFTERVEGKQMGLQNQKRTYAVAVRDCEDLFLFLSICRDTQGDVYANFPRDHKPDWKPHSSYHASGQHHQKSFGYKALVRHRQKPDANFRGTENIVTMGIASDEDRATNMPCQTVAFQDVLEIPISELESEKYRTMISVDIMEAGGQPIVTPGAKIIRQAVFQDTVPWIQVTLFDTDPRGPAESQ